MRLLLFLVSSIALAQPQQDILQTAGSWNGRWWETSKIEVKSTYVNGLRDGMMLGLIKLGSVPEAQTLYKTYEPKGFVIADLIIELDRLYANRANIRIPVVFAYNYVIQKLKGTTDTELDALLTRMRRGVADQ